VLIPLVLACFALLPAARAQLPPPVPDGGYPGFNTAEGFNALLSVSSGTFNTALGFNTLRSDIAGRFNTAVGAQALFHNNGNSNAAVGVNALFSNTTGVQNVAIGQGALGSNTGGGGNTATGFQALSTNTASGNTAYGNLALSGNTNGTGNVAVGESALLYNDGNDESTAVGTEALALGGDHDTAVGFHASRSAEGARNTAIGYNALLNVLGSNNIALGDNAGANLFFEFGTDNNIEIGNRGEEQDSDTIRIGSSQTRTFVAGIRGKTTGNANAVPVVIDSFGQLGTVSSSRRFKNEIKPMDRPAKRSLLLNL
jgi:trimeric autotransporter adhesin